MKTPEQILKAELLATQLRIREAACETQLNDQFYQHLGMLTAGRALQALDMAEHHSLSELALNAASRRGRELSSGQLPYGRQAATPAEQVAA